MALADAESKDRSSLLTKYKMMATDLENLREKMENEAMRKSDALKALSKAQAEIQLWKSRFETEGMGRVEELEAARNKLRPRSSSGSLPSKPKAWAALKSLRPPA